MDYVRGRKDMPYLYGRTKEETVQNMLKEIECAVYYNFWDEGDESQDMTTWTIKENVPHLEGVSPRLREILQLWNGIPCEKRLTIYNYGRSDLQIYCDDGCDNCDDSSFEISREEKLELLYLMVDLNVHNNNGWKLDGSHFYEPEKYPPRYPVPAYCPQYYQEDGVAQRKRKREDTDMEI